MRDGKDERPPWRKAETLGLRWRPLGVGQGRYNIAIMWKYEIILIFSRLPVPLVDSGGGHHKKYPETAWNRRKFTHTLMWKDIPTLPYCVHWRIQNVGMGGLNFKKFHQIRKTHRIWLPCTLLNGLRQICLCKSLLDFPLQWNICQISGNMGSLRPCPCIR